MEDYRIFEFHDNVSVELIGEMNRVQVKDSPIRIKRASISEGILESQLAEKSGALMHNGNTYRVTVGESVLYVEIDGEYAYIGASIIHKPENLE